MMLFARLLSICCLVAAFAVVPVFAQDDEASQDEQSQSDASQPQLSQPQLEQLVAPIALYPDSLLSQILMASTYPLEVVEAARWSKDNSGLKGDTAVSAVSDQDWDPSVKALVAFPDVLSRMDSDLRWLQRLGNAVAAQESDVMTAVQTLRQKAAAASKLDHPDRVEVTREQDDVVLESPNPDVVYVPYYDPSVVYGPWPWPAYPPCNWPPPPGYAVGADIVWAGGVRVFPSFFFSSLYWPQRTLILVDRRPRPHPDFVLHYRNRTNYARIWHFDPRRRYGFSYRTRPFPFDYGPPFRGPGFSPPGSFSGRAGQPPPQWPPMPPGGGPRMPDKRGIILPGAD